MLKAMTRSAPTLLWPLLLGLLALWGFLLTRAQQDPLPPGPGKDLVLAHCQACHGLELVARERLSRERWHEVLRLMRSFGLQITPEEEAAILDYLTLYLGLNPPPEPAPQALAPRTGKEVYANCQGCHGPQGEGNPPAFPPLKGHVESLLRAEGGRTYLLLAVLYGLQGPIQVGGQAYNGVMPGFAWLSDEDLALLLNHLAAWGAPQGFRPYTPEEVAEARKTPLAPEEVLRRRQALRLP